MMSSEHKLLWGKSCVEGAMRDIDLFNYCHISYVLKYPCFLDTIMAYYIELLSLSIWAIMIQLLCV